MLKSFKFQLLPTKRQTEPTFWLQKVRVELLSEQAKRRMLGHQENI